MAKLRIRPVANGRQHKMIVQEVVHYKVNVFFTCGVGRWWEQKQLYLNF